MANIFHTLPTTAGNGSGAGVDVSAMGSTKTFTVEGNGFVFEPSLVIEIANDAAGVEWTPLVQFEQAGSITVDVACRFVRATTQNYRGGGALVVGVGSNDVGTSFVNPIATTGDGSGAGVSSGGLGQLWTIQVTGAFRGAVVVEISEDAGTSWATLALFYAAGQQTVIVTAEEVRVTRNGIPSLNPGLPIINIGACEIGGGGGGGGGGNAQRFQYTVTGIEPDLSELTIPLPAARANALYLVFPAQEEATFLLISDVETASKTTVQFVLTLSNDATAGDVFSFLVDDPT